MSDENLNLNKNLLEGGGEGARIYRKYVRIKGGQTKCVRLRTRREGGLILAIFVRTYNMDDPKNGTYSKQDICTYVLPCIVQSPTLFFILHFSQIFS